MHLAVAPLLSSEPSAAELEQIVGKIDALIRSNPDFEPARVRYFRFLALKRLGRKEEAARALREAVLINGVAPFRTRAGETELDAMIEAMRALQGEGAETREKD